MRGKLFCVKKSPPNPLQKTPYLARYAASAESGICTADRIKKFSEPRARKPLLQKGSLGDSSFKGQLV